VALANHPNWRREADAAVTVGHGARGDRADSAAVTVARQFGTPGSAAELFKIKMKVKIVQNIVGQQHLGIIRVDVKTRGNQLRSKSAKFKIRGGFVNIVLETLS